MSWSLLIISSVYDLMSAPQLIFIVCSVIPEPLLRRAVRKTIRSAAASKHQQPKQTPAVLHQNRLTTILKRNRKRTTKTPHPRQRQKQLMMAWFAFGRWRSLTITLPPRCRQAPNASNTAKARALGLAMTLLMCMCRMLSTSLTAKSKGTRSAAAIW